MHSGRYTYPCVSNAWWMTVSASATSGAMGRGDFASACTSSATCWGSKRMLVSDDRERWGRRRRAVRRARRMGCPMSTRIHSPSRKSAADSRHNPENALPHRDPANGSEAGLSLLQTFSRQRNSYYSLVVKSHLLSYLELRQAQNTVWGSMWDKIPHSKMLR